MCIQYMYIYIYPFICIHDQCITTNKHLTCLDVGLAMTPFPPRDHRFGPTGPWTFGRTWAHIPLALGSPVVWPKAAPLVPWMIRWQIFMGGNPL